VRAAKMMQRLKEKAEREVERQRRIQEQQILAIEAFN